MKLVSIRPLGRLAALALAGLLAPAPVAEAQTTLRNPIKEDGADPWLQYYNGNYYLMTTTWTSELIMKKSPTLSGLASAPSVVIWSDSTASRCCQVWAPEFHLLSGPNGNRLLVGQEIHAGVPALGRQRGLRPRPQRLF